MSVTWSIAYNWVFSNILLILLSVNDNAVLTVLLVAHFCLSTSSFSFQWHTAGLIRFCIVWKPLLIYSIWHAHLPAWSEQLSLCVSVTLPFSSSTPPPFQMLSYNYTYIYGIFLAWFYRYSRSKWAQGQTGKAKRIENPTWTYYAVEALRTPLIKPKAKTSATTTAANGSKCHFFRRDPPNVYQSYHRLGHFPSSSMHRTLKSEPANRRRRHGEKRLKMTPTQKSFRWLTVMFMSELMCELSPAGATATLSESGKQSGEAIERYRGQSVAMDEWAFMSSCTHATDVSLDIAILYMVALSPCFTS